MGNCCSEEKGDYELLITKRLSQALEILNYRKDEVITELAQIKCYMADSNKYKEKYQDKPEIYFPQRVKELSKISEIYKKLIILLLSNLKCVIQLNSDT